MESRETIGSAGRAIRLVAALVLCAGAVARVATAGEAAGSAATAAPSGTLSDPAAGAPAEKKPVDVRVSGQVLDARTRQGVPGAVVFVREWRTISDAEGRFFIVLPVGNWVVEAAASQYLPGTTPTVSACVGCQPEVEVLLVPERFVREEVTVSASVNGSSDSVATTPLRPAEVLNVAGAFENVFRVLQTLPGVTSTGEVSSRLSVRGGGPDENVTLMDGVEIHNPYRLYGLVSAFNPETVEGFELTTGAFSAQYGDRLSSTLTIENRAGRANTAATGSVGLSLTDGNAIFEGRLPGQRGSWLVTGRRTWYDLIGDRFTDDDLPGFHDLQGRLALDLGAGRSLTLTGLRSREQADMTFDEDFDSGVMNTNASNDLAAATLFLPLGARGSSRTTGAIYDSADDLQLDASFRDETRRSNSPFDDLGFSQDEVAGTLQRGVRDNSLRHELTLQAFGRHVLGAGLEVHGLETREKLAIELENRPDEGLFVWNQDYDSKHSNTRFGAWLLDRFQLGSRVDVEAGLRYDESSLNDAGELQPRLSVSTRLNPSTRLRAAFGVHTQSPGYEKLFQSDYVIDLSAGALKLDNERALHYVVGFERDLAPGTTVRVEGFYKQLSDLIIGRRETPQEVAARLAPYDFPAELASSVPSEPMITSEPINGARGTAKGFDVFLVRRPTSSATRLGGWLAYTFTSADREAHGYKYPFEYEQRHALNAVASFRASQRLELSLTGRFASGFPRTAPVGLYVAGVQDAADGDGDGIVDEIIPERDPEGRYVYAIDYGGMANVNRAHQSWYSRVDFRATFVPRWGKGRWRLYVDLINVLGRNNGTPTEKLEYDPEGTRPRVVTESEGGFPFLPSFGIHVRF